MEESIRKPIITTPSISGAVCNFKSAFAGLPLKSHVIDITAQQESGTPSPSDPKAITGFSAINISHSGADTSNPDVVTIQLGSTIYGGTYDAISGLLTVTHGYISMGGRTYTRTNAGSYYYFTAAFPQRKIVSNDFLCEIYEFKGVSANVLNTNYSFSRSNTGTGLFFRNDDYTDPTAFANFMADYYIVYELETPQVIQLKNCRLENLLGENNIFADTGNSVIQPFKVS